MTETYSAELITDLIMDVEEDKVYFKLDAAEANEHKKEVLEVTESFIQAEIALRKFNDYRIRERKMVSRLKNDLKDIYKGLQKFAEKLPQKIHHREKHTSLGQTGIEVNEKHRKEKKKMSKNISQAMRYKIELEEIRAKIAKLS